ncbi:hypothetical protein MUN89_09170 [Halobacillus salinarum]|uniref:Uncharacterized protein n=1 Tax=Halobacillus salinarum TaxID=2932257 RepID=A0ABY4EQY5_9BACI|nr:hypothetical protein [Halobacillus salinarum]UOQ46064.1 hypothetical protein MUN89_09170 [Halobacillus salinarum]
MMEFLYFPEDKSEYIPAIISLLIFVVGAVITMYIIVKASRKQERKSDENYQTPANQEQKN